MTNQPEKRESLTERQINTLKVVNHTRMQLWLAIFACGAFLLFFAFTVIAFFLEQYAISGGGLAIEGIISMMLNKVYSYFFPKLPETKGR